MRFFKDKSERVLRLVQDLGYHLLMHDKEQYALEDVTEITEAEAIWTLILDATFNGIPVFYKGIQLDVDRVFFMDNKNIEYGSYCLEPIASNFTIKQNLGEFML